MGGGTPPPIPKAAATVITLHPHTDTDVALSPARLLRDVRGALPWRLKGDTQEEGVRGVEPGRRRGEERGWVWDWGREASLQSCRCFDREQQQQQAPVEHLETGRWGRKGLSCVHGRCCRGMIGGHRSWFCIRMRKGFMHIHVGCAGCFSSCSFDDKYWVFWILFYFFVDSC